MAKVTELTDEELEVQVEKYKKIYEGLLKEKDRRTGVDTPEVSSRTLGGDTRTHHFTVDEDTMGDSGPPLQPKNQKTQEEEEGEGVTRLIHFTKESAKKNQSG